MNEKNLTKYSKGSVLEMLTISLPIMVSSAATFLMMMIDRAMLSHYSEQAFNACFAAIQWHCVFFFILLEFALITEVFVGQFNGAQRYKEIGPATWQMIWFCLSSYVIFIPLCFFLLPYLIAENIAELGIPYLKITTLFIPIDCIGYGALTAFFVGRGETRIISVVSILSNVVNAVLDYLLIFGLRWNGEEVIPELGIVGAATATVISVTVSTVLLFVLFLKKSYRDTYNTLSCRFDPKFLWHCLKIGFPNALNRGVGCLFWALVTSVLVSRVATQDFTAFGIANSIYLFLWFVIEGAGAGTRTVCSNAIGSKEFKIVQKNMKSWSLMGVLFCSLIGAILLFYPKYFIKIFKSSAEAQSIVFEMLHWVWGMYIMDYIGVNLFNILIAAGDTRFTMIVNTVCFFGFAVIPTYVAVVYFNQTSIVFFKFELIDLSTRIILFARRYMTGRWMLHRII